MWVLTMNTGELREVKPQVNLDEIAALRTAFANSEPIAGHPDYHVQAAQWAGGCCWKLFFRGESVLMSFLAWHQVGVEETWKNVSLHYEQAAEFIDLTNSRPRRRPPKPPWLALVVYLMPDAMELSDSQNAGHVNLLLAATLVQEARQMNQDNPRN